MNFINNKDKVGSSLILLFALVYLNASVDISVYQVSAYEVMTAKSLPTYLALMTIFVCLVQIFVPTREAAGETISDAIAGFQWKPCLLLAGLMLLYSLTFKFFGFFIGTFLFLFTGFSILKEKRYLLSTTIALSVAGFMWIILTQVFDIYLDSGELFRLFGGK